MGLLDDAIREHLELKRKHGADPEDVARQEQEALGPGRRNEFAQPEAAEPSPPLNAEPPPATEEPAEPPAGYEEDPWLDEDRDEVPAEEALHQPLDTSEDVLEETPDFLQETPEHDRLWFEQKPPRDFDWDK
jgi:hypothetical protein